MDKDSWNAIIESDRGHKKSWSDTSELNYWGRILGFQELDYGYKLKEVIP